MTTPQEIVRLKITLDAVKPAVIRRVEVPVSITLNTLHEMIQAIMPWENSHLHAFYLRLIDGPRWAPLSPLDDDFDFGIKTRDSTRTTFMEVLAEPNFKVLRYNYDFGDDWRHTIKVERRFSAELRDEFPARALSTPTSGAPPVRATRRGDGRLVVHLAPHVRGDQADDAFRLGRLDTLAGVDAADADLVEP
jgi:hypothetical protein